MSESAKGFLIPVEVKYIDSTIGHGVFSSSFIKAGTLLWRPTLVKKYDRDEAREYMSKIDRDAAAVWLRQAFVIAEDSNFLCVNIDDEGRFVNHSSNPNTMYASDDEPSVALKDILEGEELTCNYGGLGCPEWYQSLCVEYNVLSTDEVTRLFK